MRSTMTSTVEDYTLPSGVNLIHNRLFIPNYYIKDVIMMSLYMIQLHITYEVVMTGPYRH